MVLGLDILLKVLLVPLVKSAARINNEETIIIIQEAVWMHQN